MAQRTEIQTLIDRIQELINKSLTGRSPLFISGTSAVTGLNGYAIKFKEDTVIASISYAANSDSDTLAGELFVAGDVVYLNSIDSIQLTSGAVFIYQH